MSDQDYATRSEVDEMERNILKQRDLLMAALSARIDMSEKRLDDFVQLHLQTSKSLIDLTALTAKMDVKFDNIGP